MTDEQKKPRLTILASFVLLRDPKDQEDPKTFNTFNTFNTSNTSKTFKTLMYSLSLFCVLFSSISFVLEGD
jgi:hypothetical protein